MSEQQRGTPGRVEPGLHPEGGAPGLSGAPAEPIGEPHLHAAARPDLDPAARPDPNPVPGPDSDPILNDIEAELARLTAIVDDRVDSQHAAPAADPVQFEKIIVPTAAGTQVFAAPPDVPQFAPGPDVPRFAEAPGAAQFGQPILDADRPLPPPPADPEAPLFSKPASMGQRLGLALAGAVSLGAILGGLLWYNGQRKVDHSMEVLARSSRTAEQAPANVTPPVAAPVQPSIQTAPQAVPPLVLLPPEKGGGPKPAAEDAAATPAAPGAAVPPPAAAAPAKVATKPAGVKANAKPAKPGAKTAARKKTDAKAQTKRPGANGAVRKTTAQKAQAAKRPPPCKRGELARVCLGLSE